MTPEQSERVNSLGVADGRRGGLLKRSEGAKAGLPPEHLLPEPALRFWMAGPELSKLAIAAHEWFLKLGKWAIWPAMQLDPLECSLPVLNLLAWERNIKRYPGEPERLYRLRVKYAYANGRDSGSIAGWKRIFARLELPAVELEERLPGQDWDIINIVLDDSDMPDSQNVLEIIINDYGRTCRRYRFVSRVFLPVLVRSAGFDAGYCTVLSEDNEQTGSIAYMSHAEFAAEFSTHFSGD